MPRNRKQHDHTRDHDFSFVILLVALMFGIFSLIFLIPQSDNGGGDGGSVVLPSDANVEMRYYTERGEYEELGDGVLFGGEWEPNTTQIVYLQIKNNNSYRVKYTLSLTADVSEVYGAFVYAALDGAQAGNSTLSWDDFVAAQEVKALVDGSNPLTSQGGVYVDANSSSYVAFAVHMNEESGNEYQNKSCVINVIMLAAQV